jgi:hypothetical protein
LWQAIGISLETRRLDIFEQAILKSVSVLYRIYSHLLKKFETICSSFLG